MIHFTLSPESAEVVMTIIQRTKKITRAPLRFAIFGEVCSKVKLFIKIKKKLSDGIDQGHPTTVFCKISVRGRGNCLEFSIARETLKICR